MAKKMHHLNIGDNNFEVVDKQARDDVSTAANNATIANNRIDELVTGGSVLNPEETLWEGSASEVNDEIELEENATDYDYIDIYYNPSSNESCGILTVSSDKLVSEMVTINYLSFANGLSEQVYLTLQSVNGSETLFKIKDIATWEWDGDHTSDAEYEEDISNFIIYKIVGRKVVGTAEIEDIRVGADGTIYESAGDAVRSQIAAINDILGDLDDALDELNGEVI